MRETLSNLFKQRAELVKSAHDFLDNHTESDGKISGENMKIYDRIRNKLADVDDSIDEVMLEMATAVENFMEQPTRKPIREKPQNNLFGFGAVEAHNHTGVAGEDYRKNFFNQVRQNFYDARNVLTESPSDTGSYLLPSEFHDELVSKLKDENILRTISRVITTQNDRKIAISTGTTMASFVAEGMSIPLQDFEFAQRTLGAYKLAAATAVSNELLQDSAFDLESFLADEFAAAIGRAEENALINGDGVNQPLGLIEILDVNSDTAVVQTAGANIAADDILTLIYRLPRVYRKNAVFLANDATISAIRKLKDGNLAYIWQPAMTADEPDRLLGYRIYSSEFVPNIAAGKTCLLFGDFSKFFIGERGSSSFRALREIRALNDESVFLLTSRFDGVLADVSAIRGVKIKS